MCGYTTRMFGSPYPDAECIDGYMWDLDSFEDGLLTSGGDIACPSCNTAEWLTEILRGAHEDLPQNNGSTPAATWEAAVRRALKLNAPAAEAHLAALPPFWLLDRTGRIASAERPWRDAEDPEDADIVERDWPWPMPEISQHLMLRITPRG